MDFKKWWQEHGKKCWDRPGSTVIALVEEAFKAGETHGLETVYTAFSGGPPSWMNIFGKKLDTRAVDALKSIRDLRESCGGYFPYDKVMGIIESAIGTESKETSIPPPDVKEAALQNLLEKALAFAGVDTRQPTRLKYQQDMLNSAALRYRRAIEEEEHILFVSGTIEVWGYYKDGKQTITRARNVK